MKYTKEQQQRAEDYIKRLANQAADIVYDAHTKGYKKATHGQLTTIVKRIVSLWPICAEHGPTEYLAYLANTYVSERYRSLYK